MVSIFSIAMTSWIALSFHYDGRIYSMSIATVFIGLFIFGSGIFSIHDFSMWALSFFVGKRNITVLIYRKINLLSTEKRFCFSCIMFVLYLAIPVTVMMLYEFFAIGTHIPVFGDYLLFLLVFMIIPVIVSMCMTILYNLYLMLHHYKR